MDYYKKYLKYKGKYLSLKLGGSSKYIFDNVDNLKLIKLANNQVTEWKLMIKKLLNDSFKKNIPVDTSIVSTWYLLVKEDKLKNKLIGCVLLDSNNIIWNLATLKECRGRGVASKLIEHLIQDSKSDIYLWINLSRPPEIQDKLINFYKKFDFKIENTIPDKLVKNRPIEFRTKLMIKKK